MADSRTDAQSGDVSASNSNKRKAPEPTTKKKKHPLRNLIPVLQTLEGETISVELKDERLITGIFDSVDSEVNIWLGKSKGKFLEGRYRSQEIPPMELVFLSSKSIRYIHLPANVNLEKNMKQEWERKHKADSFKRTRIRDVAEKPE